MSDDSKKSRNYLLIIIIVILAVLCVGQFVYMYRQNQRENAYLAELNEQMDAEEEELSAEEEELKAEEEELDAEKEEMEAAEEELRAAEEELGDLMKKVQDESSMLEEEEARIAALEGQIEEESELLDAEQSERKEKEEAEQSEKKEEEEAEQKALEESEQAAREESEAAEEALQEDIRDSDFYQKLSKGYDCRILVVGDDIGYGSGSTEKDRSWPNLLQSYLSGRYGSDVSVTNLSLPGNSTYAGYCEVMMQEDEEQYDAVIICFGKSDGENRFALHYEALIRAAAEKFEGCAILAMVEPEKESYRVKNGYSENARTVVELCGYYDLALIDPVGVFNQKYSMLTDADGMPNNSGQRELARAADDVISHLVSVGAEVPDYDSAEVREEAVQSFENFIYLSADEFERLDEVTYYCSGVSTDPDSEAVLGVDCSYTNGENRIQITLDDDRTISFTAAYKGDGMERHIDLIRDNCKIEDEIRIVFKDAESADTFNGIALSWGA